MARPSVLTPLLLLLLALPAAAQELTGEFDLAGRYNTRRGTAAVLKVARTPTGALTVERTGRYTAASYATRPPFVWRSGEVTRRNARTFDVRYRLSSGLAGGVAGGPVTNVLWARYVVAADGRSIREEAVNFTRRGEESFWASLTTSGPRKASAPTQAQALELARAGITDHVQRVRMHEGDWTDYFPSTWPELVAAGVPAKIAAFGSGPDDEVLQDADKFTFVGRGPYDLYTEVEVSKRDGSILRVYIEID